MDLIDRLLKLRSPRNIMIFFLKLNLLNILQEEILNVLKNEVLSTELQMDGFFFVCKRIVSALEEALMDKDFPFRSQIISLSCWKSLKKRYSNKPKNEKNEAETSFANSVSQKNLQSPNTTSKKKVVLGRETSENKIKTSFSVHSLAGLPKLKSAATVFLTTPKMKGLTSPKGKLNDIKEKGNHQKSKTILMSPFVKN